MSPVTRCQTSGHVWQNFILGQGLPFFIKIISLQFEGGKMKEEEIKKEIRINCFFSLLKT